MPKFFSNVSPFSPNWAILLLCLVTNVAFSQITGTVLDSTGTKPLVYATIALFPDVDSVKIPVSGGFTDDNGRFELTNLVNGKYRLEIAMTEYGVEKVKSLEITESRKKIDIGTVKLKPAEAQLNAVMIEGQRPIVESKQDKLIYNVENDLMSQGSMTLELMKKVPFVIVDQDDKIKVKGNASFKVLVNGKSTGIISRNPSEALKAYPANAIKKIEVITNPSAKYDAEGATAVINIITKKQLSGYNGGASASINTYKQGWGNLYFNIKQNKLGISGYFGGNRWGGVPNLFNSTFKSLSATNPYTQYTEGSTIYQNLGGYGNVELAYDIDTLKSLSLYSNFNLWTNGSNSATHFKQIGVNNELQRQSDILSRSSGRERGSDVGLDYVHKFGNTSSEHELSISALYMANNGNDSSFNQNNYASAVAKQYRNENVKRNSETTVSINYTVPFKKYHKIDAGVKSIFRSNNSDYSNYIFDTTSLVYQLNPALSNKFAYNQNIYAAYTEYTVEIKRWMLKPGVRVEHTQTRGNFETVDTLIKFQYTNLIPTFTISYKLTETQTIKLFYNKRLQRPDLWYLNPFVDNSNPLSVSTGNPYLLPERAHNVDLSYSKFGGFGNLNVYLAQSIQSRGINSFTTFDATKGIAYTNYYNFGKVYSTALGINLSFKIGKNFNAYFNSTGIYNILINNFKGVSYKNSGFMINGYGNASYQLPKNFKISANGTIWTGDVNIQGRNGLWYNYGIGIGKSFFNKKLSINLGIQNFVNKYIKSKSYMKDPNFESNSVYYNPVRAARLSISYNFGSLQENISRKKGISNDDAKGKGSK